MARGGVRCEVSKRIGCGLRFHRNDLLRRVCELRSRAWFRLSYVWVESRLTRGLAFQGLKKLSKLSINFFQLLDRTAELFEGFVEGAGRWSILRSHRSIVVVVIDDKRWHGAIFAGVRQGVGWRLFELEVKSLPFGKKCRERYRVLLRVLVAEVVVIVVKVVDDGGGVGCLKIAGRNLA